MAAAFNLACRRLQAAILSDPRLSTTEVRVFERGISPLSEWTAALEEFEPDILAASAYLWSLPTFTVLAREVKRRWPHCITIVGGPSARPPMLDLAPFRDAARSIDVLALGEGEHVICEMAARYGEGVRSFENIPGLALHSPLGWRKTPAQTMSLSIDKLPSPYRMGLVPPNAMAYLETYRGCPMSCSFCQWGDLDPAGGVLSTDAIVAEFEALETLCPFGVALTDAALNLNSRAFRNLHEAARRTGFLKNRYFDAEMYPTLVKPEHIEFLSECDANVGVGLQTANEAVLTRIDRKFKRQHFAKVITDLANVSKVVTVEVIVGLPGDSIQGFRETLHLLRDLPCAVRVYHCLVLPDAFMKQQGALDGLDFDPITLELRSGPGWSPRDLAEIGEWLSDLSAFDEDCTPPEARVKSDRIEDYVEGRVDPKWWGLSEGTVSKRRERPPTPHVNEGVMAKAQALHSAQHAVHRATKGYCRLESLRILPDKVNPRLDVEGRNYEFSVRRAAEGIPAFRIASGLAFVHHSASETTLPPRDELLICRAIDAMSQHVLEVLADPAVAEPSAELAGS